MITNLSDFIKPVNDNPENLLKGVVTPYDQKFNRKTEDGFSLFEIINNESLKSRFNKFVFPEFRIMDNGEIFMSPVKRVIQTLHEYYIKWMVLDDKFAPSHDHDYPYVNVPRNGYLVKIVIPVLTENPNDFDIEYICDINNIQTNIYDSINNINQPKVIDASQNAINVDIKEELGIEPFDPSLYPDFFKIISDKKRFSDKYLQHIFE